MTPSDPQTLTRWGKIRYGLAAMLLGLPLPVVMQRKKVMIGLYGLSVNQKFKYDRFFAMSPNGQNPKLSVSKPHAPQTMLSPTRSRGSAFPTSGVTKKETA